MSARELRVGGQFNASGTSNSSIAVASTSAAEVLTTLAPDLLDTASQLIVNYTNSTDWLTASEVEHFLGDPDVLHGMALLLGVGAIALGKRLPHMLAAVASLSLGLWVGLIVQDRQHFDNPLFGTVSLPEGQWVPWVAGICAGSAGAVLSYFTWKAALALLTAGLVALIAMASCRLANVSPDKIFKLGSNLLSSYRVVGAAALALSVIVFFCLVRKFHKHMADFASAQLGTLLLLSGVSHFSARVGAEAPFSLLDDLARIAAEVRGGNCHLWESNESETAEAEDSGLVGCDCSDQCRTEISAWLVSAATVLITRWIIRWHRKRKAARDKPSVEETAPLADSRDSGGATPSASPSVVGRSQV